MERIPLEDLGISKRWPRLAKLQDDLADFQGRHRRADAQLATLRSQLPAARGLDLDNEAKALRAGKTPPKPKHEAEVRANLEAAERERDVAERAIQIVHEDLGAFHAEHQQALYDDVVAVRATLARELGEHARASLAAYARHEDLGHHVKRLRPAAPVDENAGAQRLTQAFAGMVHTTLSDGPPRGDVEAILGYLAGLGGGEEEGGANDAA